MILFWQNLRKAVCFGQNVFFLGIAGKNSRFCQNYFDLQGLKLELRHGEFEEKKNHNFWVKMASN